MSLLDMFYKQIEQLSVLRHVRTALHFSLGVDLSNYGINQPASGDQRCYEQRISSAVGL